MLSLALFLLCPASDINIGKHPFAQLKHGLLKVITHVNAVFAYAVHDNIMNKRTESVMDVISQNICIFLRNHFQIHVLVWIERERSCMEFDDEIGEEGEKMSVKKKRQKFWREIKWRI